MNAISKHFEKKTHKMFYECIRIVYDRDTERILKICINHKLWKKTIKNTF